MLLKQNRYSEGVKYLGMGVEFWPMPCQAHVNLKYTQRCNDGIRSYPRSLFIYDTRTFI